MLFAIAAVDKNFIIGKDNQLPWHEPIPADLKFFRKTTKGLPIVMGRKTHESIGRPLSKRENIILTRNPDYTAEGCTVYHNIEPILERAQNETIAVIGGEQVYRLLEPHLDRVYLTQVDTEVDGGDTEFPIQDFTDWQVHDAWEIPAGNDTPYDLRVVIYDKIRD